MTKTLRMAAILAIGVATPLMAQDGFGCGAQQPPQQQNPQPQ